jgi:hypothetical protein
MIRKFRTETHLLDFGGGASASPLVRAVFSLFDGVGGPVAQAITVRARHVGTVAGGTDFHFSFMPAALADGSDVTPGTDPMVALEKADGTAAASETVGDITFDIKWWVQDDSGGRCQPPAPSEYLALVAWWDRTGGGAYIDVTFWG